jgi:hypothetical protein
VLLCSGGSEEEIRLACGTEGYMEDFVLEDMYTPEEKVAQRRGLESNTTGLRYPIWFAACSYTKIVHTFKAPGTNKKESGFVKLATCDSPESPACQSHPHLRFLAEALAHYLDNFHGHLVPEVTFHGHPEHMKTEASCNQLAVQPGTNGSREIHCTSAVQDPSEFGLVS